MWIRHKKNLFSALVFFTTFAVYAYFIYGDTLYSDDDFAYLARALDPWGEYFAYLSPLSINKYRPVVEGIFYDLFYFPYKYFGLAVFGTFAFALACVENVIYFRVFLLLSRSIPVAFLLTLLFSLFPGALAKYEYFTDQISRFLHDMGWLLFLLAWYSRKRRKLFLFSATAVCMYTQNTGVFVPALALLLPEKKFPERLKNLLCTLPAFIPFVVACWPAIVGKSVNQETLFFYSKHFHHLYYPSQIQQVTVYWDKFIYYLNFFAQALLPWPTTYEVNQYWGFFVLLLGTLFALFKKRPVLRSLGFSLLAASLFTVVLVSVVPFTRVRYMGFFLFPALMLVALLLRSRRFSWKMQALIAALFFIAWLPTKLNFLAYDLESRKAFGEINRQIVASVTGQYDALPEKDKPCEPRLGEAPEALVKFYGSERVHLNDYVFLIISLKQRMEGYGLEQIYKERKPCPQGFSLTMLPDEKYL